MLYRLTLRTLLFPGALALLVSGCSISEPEPPGPAPVTELYGFRLTPFPVRAGETARFHARVRDSTDRTLRYKWGLATGPGSPPPSVSIVVTDTPGVRWTAPSVPGTYRHQVLISRPPTPDGSLGQDFSIVVIE